MSIIKVQEMIQLWGGGITAKRRKQKSRSKLPTDDVDLAKIKRNLKSINSTISKTNKNTFTFLSQNMDNSWYNGQITEGEQDTDSDSDITDIDDEQYMYEYTEQDLAFENIGIVEYKAHTKSSPSISQTLIEDTVSDAYDDDDSTNDYKIQRQKEIAFDLDCLCNINSGDSDSECDILCLEILFVKYKISNEIIDTLKCKLNLCGTDSIEKLLQNKPSDIIYLLNMQYTNMSVKECICLYKLIHHCVAFIRNGQYAYKLSNQVQQSWKHFNDTKIIFNISTKTDKCIKYNKLDELNTIYKKNIVMNGNQMKNICTKKIKNKTTEFAISIGKLGYEMNLWIKISNGKRTEKIQIDENGIIYVNDVYKAMVIPYNNKYIDSGSIIVCKINKRTHGQNDEMKIKMKHKKYGKTVSKSQSISLKLNGNQKINLSLKISQKDGRGEYSLL